MPEDDGSVVGGFQGQKIIIHEFCAPSECCLCVKAEERLLKNVQKLRDPSFLLFLI